MSFKDLLYCAKAGDEIAFAQILDMYRPLLLKKSIINGMFDEDLFQEQCITLLKCIKAYKQ